MGMTTDDMIAQLRGRKIPYDNKVNDSIDYAIACIKGCESLEITARKYIKLQADYENRLKADMVAMLTELMQEIDEEKIDTKHLHYDELEQAESYNSSNDNCIALIQQKIDTLKKVVEE